MYDNAGIVQLMSNFSKAFSRVVFTHWMNFSMGCSLYLGDSGVVMKTKLETPDFANLIEVWFYCERKCNYVFISLLYYEDNIENHATLSF